MSNPNYNIEITLVDDKVKFTAVSQANSGQPITFDYIPPIGSGNGFAGLELLTLCFSGCVSTAILFILRKRGMEITGYKARIYGFKRESPLSLEKIIYEAELMSGNTEDLDLNDVIEKARTISPVWLSLNPNIEVSASIRLV